MSEMSLFEELYKLDISKEVETENLGFGNIEYLPWAKGWRLIKKFDPGANFEIIRSLDGLPFFQSDFGVFVGVQLTIKTQTIVEWYPVETPKNGVTVQDIANSHQRALIKAAGRHGLGLRLWEKEPPKKHSTKKEFEIPQDPGEYEIKVGAYKGQKINKCDIHLSEKIKFYKTYKDPNFDFQELFAAFDLYEAQLKSKPKHKDDEPPLIELEDWDQLGFRR